ncbi:MAG: hypothetical protein ACYDB7_15270, partial [Mycobacteriales bacterium]
YWRRRAVAGGVALFVVLVIVESFGGGSARRPAGRVAGPSAGSPTAATRVPAGPCVAADLTVTAVTDAVSYPAGVDPRVLVTVTDGGGRCVLAAGPVVTVTSGSDRIWSSGDCGGAGGQLVLAPGPRTIAVVWTRRRSEPGCAAPPTGASPVASGTYHATVTLDGLTAAAPAFHL